MSAASITIGILGIYSFLIIIFSVIGNTITLIVCRRSKDNCTFILLQYLTVNNLIAVSYWSLAHFILSQFDLDIQSYSMFTCKFGSWIQFSSLQASAWILVSITLERYLSFKIKLWNQKYFKTKIAHVFAALICFVIFGFNSNVLFKFGHEFYRNETHIVQCFATIPSTQWMNIWNFVHSFLYSFIPFTLIAILNMLLLIHLNGLRNARKEGTLLADSPLSRKQMTINVTIMIITILFIVFTSPGAVISQFYSTLIMTETGTALIFLGDCITFSYHAFTIIILCLSNKEFLRKLKNNKVEATLGRVSTTVNN